VKVVAIPLEEHQSVSLAVKGACHLLVLHIVTHARREDMHQLGIILLVLTVRRGTTVLRGLRSRAQKERLQNPNKSTVPCAQVEANVLIMSSPLVHRDTTASMERDPCAPLVPTPYKGVLPAQSATLDSTL
jgi:hypothetical protein